MPRLRLASSNTTALTTTSNQGKDLLGENSSLAARANFETMPDDIISPTPKMIAFAESKGWDMRRIQHETEKFWGFYAANGREFKSLLGLWVSWVLRGIEREEARAPLGSLEDRCRKSAQAAAVLRTIAGRE